MRLTSVAGATRVASSIEATDNIGKRGFPKACLVKSKIVYPISLHVWHPLSSHRTKTEDPVRT
jgi:hypothetical protein